MVEDPVTINERYRDESHFDWPCSASLDKYKAKLGRNVSILSPIYNSLAKQFCRCWKKYVLWSKQYRDVIVGSIYGYDPQSSNLPSKSITNTILVI